METNKKRPVRVSSYQGSYLEIPLIDNDDDSYGGRVFMGIYPSLTTEKNARENNKGRENAHLPTPGQRSSCRKIATTTHFLTEEKCLNSSKLIINDSSNCEVSLLKTKQMSSSFKKSDSVPPFGALGASQQRSSSNGDKLNNILNVLSIKGQKLRKSKKIFGGNSRQKEPDWHERLSEMYGSVEKARNRPWMTVEEKEVLETMPENIKMTEKFRCQNWDFEVKKQADVLFQLPEDDGLNSEISKQLQFVRDSLNLYQTMNLPHVQSNSRRPLFLPFLRRNLRYNNFVPISQKPLILDSQKVQQIPKVIPEPSENTESECSEQDLSIKLLSIKHNLLPVGFNASVTFFYTRYSYKIKKFLPISKIGSSTFIMEIAEEIQAVNIDLPPELDFDENDPSDIFILLRVVFFDPAKEVGVNTSRNLRNVPARLAGQCERAREAELYGKKHGQRMRETRDGDIAMFGAFQLTKKVDDGWSYCCGTTSLILIETEKLGINPNTALWQKDGSIVFRLIALGRKYHTNPFVYMEIVNGEDDDSIISSETKRVRKPKRQSDGSESSYMTACDELPVNDEYGFDYSLPQMMIYQLSLDFMYKADPMTPGKRIVTGFNAIVEENVPNNVKKIHKERKAESEPKELQPVHRQALAIMDQQAPLPKMFSYHVTKSPGWCIFCEIHCKNLFSLMWHLKTCHSRFEYLYRSAIEYKPGRFLPGFVMQKAPIDEDMYWHHRKSGICAKYDRLWPHKFKLAGSFITPCNFLFKNIVDTFQDIAPILSLKDEFNKWGPRPINYEYTVHGRLVKLLPGWMAEKMQRELNDIVDLDELEIVFMLIWNDFLFHYGPIAGKETNVYRLCRLFIELRRQKITDYHLETVTLILITYFVEQKILSTEELYDLIMRLNKNYDPFTDVLHPLSVNEKLKTQAFMKREAVKAERLKRKRPKKVYGKSSISLRRRFAYGTFSADDASRSTSKESSIDDDDIGEDVFFDCESSRSSV